MRRFECPYLDGTVELTSEREAHIVGRHPELADQMDLLSATLVEPDLVRQSPRFADARLLSRFFGDVRGGKHVVVVVANESERQRKWIMTAYLTRKITGGSIEWTRS